MQPPPWVERAERDADTIEEFMRSEYQRGIRAFSIRSLQQAGLSSRDRVYGALMILVLIRRTVEVDGAQPDSARFYLQTGAR